MIAADDLGTGGELQVGGDPTLLNTLSKHKGKPDVYMALQYYLTLNLQMIVYNCIGKFIASYKCVVSFNFTLNWITPRQGRNLRVTLM